MIHSNVCTLCVHNQTGRDTIPVYSHYSHGYCPWNQLLQSSLSTSGQSRAQNSGYNLNVNMQILFQLENINKMDFLFT